MVACPPRSRTQPWPRVAILDLSRQQEPQSKHKLFICYDMQLFTGPLGGRWARHFHDAV